MPRRHLLAPLIALAVLLAGAAVAPSAVRAAAIDDLPALQLMRITNLDRAALGLPALAVDPVLAAIAQDRSFPCPSRPGLILAGRSEDMATRAYFAHEIAGCGVTVVTILMTEFRYNTFRAENIAWNSGYGTAPTAYLTGCDESGSNCGGGTATVAADVAAAQRGFMGSPAHRATVLGAYDRFGCGSAQGGGRVYFTCLFSRGGPNPTMSLAAAADGTAPAFTATSGTGGTLPKLRTRAFGARVRDDVALRSVTVTWDGHTMGTWTLSGTAAYRAVTVPARLVTAGRHRLVWVVRDAAGNRAASSKVVTVGG